MQKKNEFIEMLLGNLQNHKESGKKQAWTIRKNKGHFIARTPARVIPQRQVKENTALFGQTATAAPKTLWQSLPPLE